MNASAMMPADATIANEGAPVDLAQSSGPAILTHANRNWMSRPDDERFASLVDLRDSVTAFRRASAAKEIDLSAIECQPDPADPRGFLLHGPNGVPVTPTHNAFTQLCGKAEAPAGYLRTLPAPMAVDCVNWGLQRAQDERIQVLLHKPAEGAPQLRAVTSPRYGRVWNAAIADALVEKFGDGITGDFRVPGEFGQRVTVTKDNTTLFASDRDMFVFLADEQRRISVVNRRNGESGSMARGFFVWNSETGNGTLGIAMFLFDYACKNRIVWGAEGFREIRVRHTSGAPDRWLSEVAPAIHAYTHASASLVTNAIEEARRARFDDDKAVSEFLAKRFTGAQVSAIKAAHLADEDRPIENVWDAVTGATAYARGIGYQDERVKIEREAGKMLRTAA